MRGGCCTAPCVSYLFRGRGRGRGGCIYNLSRPKPHARRLQDSVAASQHDKAPRLADNLDKIAVVPDAGKLRKVALLVQVLAGGAAPEAHGHAGEGREADEVAGGVVGDLCAGGGPRLHVHAEAETLDLARVDGGERGGRAKEGDDVGAAGDGGEVDGAEGAVDVFEG